LGETELSRGLREAAMVDYGRKEAEVVEIHRHNSFSLNCENNVLAL
jgi:hypothetical protein